MFISFGKRKVDLYLILSFLIGLIPASFIIHILAVDFSGFYLQAISFLKFHGYSYQILTNYCQNPLNTGLNARAPLVPLLLAGGLKLFGNNLLGIYAPFFLARLFIAPLTYAVGKFFLPRRVAFLAVVLTVFIPKLQTYSFGALEADVFVAIFYLLALFFFFQSRQTLKLRHFIFAAISLGLGALAKQTGFAIGLGFILAVIFEKTIPLFKTTTKRNGVILLLIYFLLLIGPFIAWTYSAHQQIYLSTHRDRSLSYIPANLPALLTTVPLYLTGVDFTLGHNFSLISTIIVMFFVIGCLWVLVKRHLTLLLPALLTMGLISFQSTCLIGGNTPYSIEFVTLLGFMMPVAVIILFIGVWKISHSSWQFVFKKKIPNWAVTFILLLIMFKFIRNYFSASYALDFVPTEYYISLPTILKQRQPFTFGDLIFENRGGLRIFQGPAIHREIRQQFSQYRFKPFSLFYRIAILIPTLLGLVLFTFDRQKAAPKSD